MALARQPRSISYPDYKPKDDVALWLSGYVIQNVYGYKLTEMNKIQEEVIRLIAGKLSVGMVLDVYNWLDGTNKSDNKRLVEKHTEEFANPQSKRWFNASLTFNTCKKGQSLKDFMQDMKKDMNCYSYTPETIVSVTGGVVPNPEREHQGVR